MLLIYRYLINILYPLIILIVYLRTKFNKEDKKRYKEKLFSSSFNIKKIKKKLIWFHAASLGELNSVIPLIRLCRYSLSICICLHLLKFSKTIWGIWFSFYNYICSLLDFKSFQCRSTALEKKINLLAFNML